MATKEKTHSPAKKRFALPKWAKAIFVYAISIVLIIVAIFGGYSVVFADQIYPRVAVAGVTLGGLTKEKAKAALAESLTNKKLTPIILTTENNDSFTIKPEEVDATINVEQSVEAAYSVGRSNQFFSDLIAKITTPIFGTDLPASISVDDAKFDKAIKAIVDKVTVSEKDAQLTVKDGIVTITAEVIGKGVDSDKLKQTVKDGFGASISEPIALKINDKQPVLKTDDLEQAKKQAEAIINQPIILTRDTQTFTADRNTIGSWISTAPIKGLFGSKADIQFNEEKITQFIASIASQIEQQPKNARLAVVNGAVVVTENSQDGITLKKDTAKADMLRILTLRKELPAEALNTQTISPSPIITPTATPNSVEIATNQIILETEVKKPDVTNDNIAQIGIKERIAVSTTEYKGSPANRQENIRLGTSLFNGIILKPGEQFSSVKSLGRIDEASGFKPELVIKQDELTPEVGGGLCQVTTTLFRAAMNAGLQIDDRRNHRFRVSYYEQKPSNPDPEDYISLNAKTLVGIDATIYDPNPDFKFTNDTGNYMLIQGRVEGTRVTFELFGTKDGRKTSIEGPFITSTTPAPTEVQYIDDPNLPAGETKLKEKAVAGTKTTFKYKVEKDGKLIHNNTFNSNYVPWQAKYYRGTGPAATPTPSPIPTPAAQ